MVRSKGCLIWYLPQNHSAVIETLAQLQKFLPGFQVPPDSHLLSSISSQHAGGEDPILCLSSQHTTGKVHARKGPIWDGSMPSTTELAWSTHPSSAHHQVTTALPQPAPVGVCKLTQASTQSLDLVFPLPSQDQTSWTPAPPKHSHPLPPNHAFLQDDNCY